jgi:spermidine/putrescine transport system substrate-binding protein
VITVTPRGVPGPASPHPAQRWPAVPDTPAPGRHGRRACRQRGLLEMTRRHRRPLSPEAAAIVAAMSSAPRSAGVSRRSVLSGAGALGLGAALAACGTSGTATGTGASGRDKPQAPADRSDSDRVVHWANWTAYLDYDDSTKTYPTLEAFQKQTGIEATYAEDIEDNETYLAKIQGQLEYGQDIGRDIFVFTDYVVPRLVRSGFVQPLDKANIPNAKNLLDNLQQVGFDPGRRYSLTWQSGYTGIAYDIEQVKRLGIEITKLSDLWHPKLKGRVEVLSQYQDTIGLIMLEQGVDVSAPFEDAAFDKALAVLKEQLTNGQIRQVKGNSYLEDFNSGDALAVIGWSGDILAANAEHQEANKTDQDRYQFFLPPTGGMLWSDNLLVPVTSAHKRNAEILMNYYYDPKVAAEVAAYVNYICPVKGAKEVIATDPDPDTAALADSPWIFPTDADLAKVKVFRSLKPEEHDRYQQKFDATLGV